MVFAFLLAAMFQIMPGLAQDSRQGSKYTIEPVVSGADVLEIIGELKRTNASPLKGEFETWASFNSRKATIPQDLTKPLVFTLLPGEAQANYDADQQTMSIRLKCDFRRADSGAIKTLAMRRSVSTQSSYPGQNAFGVKVSISRRTIDDKGISVDATLGLRDLSFPLGLNSARELKPHFTFAVSGLISQAIIHNVIEIRKSTISNPEDLTITGEFIPFRVTHLMVLDDRTGKAIAIVPVDKRLEPEVFAAPK